MPQQRVDECAERAGGSNPGCASGVQTAAALRALAVRRVVAALRRAPRSGPDKMLSRAGLTQDFLADASPVKVGLGVGAYRGSDGKPYVLPSIAEAEKRVVANLTDHEYAPITGDAKFLKHSLEFAYGADSAPLAEGRVAATQALSGTGCLRVAAQCRRRVPRL